LLYPSVVSERITRLYKLTATRYAITTVFSDMPRIEAPRIPFEAAPDLLELVSSKSSISYTEVYSEWLDDS
jgi:hypothetical protein